MILKLLILLLTTPIPILWELSDDKKGDVHPNNDWIYRTLLCLASGSLAVIFSYIFGTLERVDFVYMITEIFRYSLATGGVFIAAFSYLINFTNLKRSNLGLKGYDKFDYIVTHLSLTAWPDRVKLWRRIGWISRAVVYLVILTISVIVWLV